jgi:hypothetical protein
MIKPKPATAYLVSAHQTAGWVLPFATIIDFSFN